MTKFNDRQKVLLRTPEETRKRSWFLFAVLCFLFLGNTWFKDRIFSVHDSEYHQTESILHTQQPVQSATPGPVSEWIIDPLAMQKVQSGHVLVYNVETGSIIYEKASRQFTYPASLTKIMTHLLVTEHFGEEGLRQSVAISQEISQRMTEEGASVSGFLPGEKVTVEDLLYANLLASGGDASEQLAIAVAGSVSAFVDRMNKKADEIGMYGTHFMNPTGLHEPHHAMTVQDTLTLILEAMKDPVFHDILTSERYRATKTPQHPEGKWIQSTLFKDFTNTPLTFRVLGGKTGYTEEAGLCLFTYMEKGGSTFFVITMEAPYANTKTQDALDHISIMNGLTRTQREGYKR